MKISSCNIFYIHDGYILIIKTYNLGIRISWKYKISIVSYITFIWDDIKLLHDPSMPS